MQNEIEIEDYLNEDECIGTFQGIVFFKELDGTFYFNERMNTIPEVKEVYYYLLDNDYPLEFVRTEQCMSKFETWPEFRTALLEEGARYLNNKHKENKHVTSN